MRRLVREFGPDLVHGHYLTVGGLYAALSGGRRIVGSAWGSDIYVGPVKSRKERAILKFTLKRCDFVFAGTLDMAEHVRAFGYDGEIAIFRWGVDPAMFKRISRHGTSEFRILSIRPCDPIYNQPLIVEAFRNALPMIGDSYLYLLDFGSSVEEVRDIVAGDPGLMKRVRWLSRVPYENMPERYGSGDLAVSLAQSDSAAASVLESMACETPVIVTDNPPMREWVLDGETGYLSAVDAGVLSEKMRKAYALRAILPEMGRRSRAKVVDDKSQGTFEANLRVAHEAYDRIVRKAG
jgi:glycosyltransferase involved in cell wall biosynthesis